MDIHQLNLDLKVSRIGNGLDDWKVTGNVTWQSASPQPLPFPVPNPEPAPDPAPTLTKPTVSHLSKNISEPVWDTRKIRSTDMRSFEYPAAVYSNSHTRVFGTALTLTGRHLVLSNANGDVYNTIKEDVEQAVVWMHKGSAQISMLRPDGHGGMLYASGETSDFINFDWTIYSREKSNLLAGNYPCGDVHFANENGIWMKGNDFQANKYIRRWFHTRYDDSPIELMMDLGLSENGTPKQLYQIVVSQERYEGYYIGILSIYDPQAKTIDMVWGLSEDGYGWKLPFGHRPVFVRPTNIHMAICNGIHKFGDKYRFTYSLSGFKHGEFKIGAVLGANMFSVPIADIQKLVAAKKEANP